nr:malate dehydrogenase, NAD-dependent [Cryptococcus depauperatus CBS 7855]
MFARQLARQSSVLARGFASSAKVDRKVAVLGAAGGIGQPLSLLLKTNPNVSGLSLYDIRGAPGVAADISHVNTESVVKGFEKDDLKEALTDAELIIIPAGVPRKPGMSRDDLFNTNASIVRDLAEAAAEYAPKAFVGIISNPVNSTVPIFAEVLKQKGVFDEKRLFGITTLDVVRASRFLGEIKNVDPKDVKVTVVGGHSGVTIVPLLSQTSHGQDVSGEAYKALVNRIQFGGDEVVKAKAGTGSATLSMAYAGARFADSLIRALNGETGVVEPTFVKSPLYASEGVEYFASNVELGTEGVKKILPVGELTADEQELLKACLPDLAKNIKKGVDFVKA